MTDAERLSAIHELANLYQLGEIASRNVANELVRLLSVCGDCHNHVQKCACQKEAPAEPTLTPVAQHTRIDARMAEVIRSRYRAGETVAELAADYNATVGDVLRAFDEGYDPAAPAEPERDPPCQCGHARKQHKGHGDHSERGACQANDECGCPVYVMNCAECRARAEPALVEPSVPEWIPCSPTTMPKLGDPVWFYVPSWNSVCCGTADTDYFNDDSGAWHILSVSHWMPREVQPTPVPPPKATP